MFFKTRKNNHERLSLGKNGKMNACLPHSLSLSPFLVLLMVEQVDLCMLSKGPTPEANPSPECFLD